MRISKAKRLGYSILLTLRMVFSYEARQTEVCFDYKYLIYQKGEIFMKRYFQKGITAVMTMALLTSLVACGNKTEKTDAPVADPTPAEEKTETPAEEKTETPAEDTTETPTEEVTEAPAEEEDSAYVPLKDADGNVYDLGGMEIVVADWWSAAEEAEPTTAKQEETKAYRDWIQETYKFKIKQLGVDGWGEHPDTFINFATTGGDENYVFIMYKSSLAAPLASGLLYDLSTLDCLDFTESKWDGATQQLMTKNGGVYGMRPEAPEPRGGIFFNKRLLEEAGYTADDLYDIQKNNEWTWEKFEEVCQALTKDTDNDGVIDRYAMTSFSSDYFTSVLASNNAKYVDVVDGKYVNATRNNEFLDALNWGMDMLAKYEMPAPEGAEWNYAFSSFNNAEAAMIVAEEHRIGDYGKMEDEVGFLMFPMGPNSTTYTNVYNDNVSVIPACYDADRAWKIAFAYNLFTNPTPGYEDEEDWKTDMYAQFPDSRAVDETVAMMKDPAHGTTWVNDLIPGLNTGDIAWKAYDHNQTAAELVDACWDTWNAYIDEANAK